MPAHTRHQRNFLPALILTILWWVLLLLVILLVDPANIADFPFPGSYGIFFGLLFMSVWFLASLLLIHTRRGFWVALWVVGFGVLRLSRLGTVTTGFLLGGFFIALEYFLSSKKLTSTPDTGKTLIQP